MKLLFNRKMRKTIIRTLLYVLTMGVLCNIAYAQLEKPHLPILGFGVRDGGIAFQNDLGQLNDWWPDSRIWSVPSRVGADSKVEYKEVLIPVFISNRWYNFPQTQYGTLTNPEPCPGVKFQEISSFAFKVYYDDRVLQFVDIQKHHPYTEEEAKNLRTTHYYQSGNTNGEYTKPLAYNFEINASNDKATDYFRYFDKYDTVHLANGSIEYPHKGIGNIVSITGTASSFHSLDTTAPGETKVLLYLKFRVKPTTNQDAADVRSCKIYFDPTYIYYNGINIAKDRGVALLEDYPISSADPNYIPFNNMFMNALTYYTNTNDNMQYFDENWSATEKLQHAVLQCVGLQTYSNHTDIDKYTADPYLPGSITFRVMNSYNEFQFSVDNDVNSVLNSNQRIVRDATDLSLWRLTEPITADNLAFKRTAYNNTSERAVTVTTLLTYPSTMEDIVIETDQNWLKIRSVALNDAGSMIGFENKFGNLVTGQTPVRRAYCQRINNLVGPTDDYDPFPNTNNINKPVGFKVFFVCDQTGLLPGEYVGYVTFKSPFDRHEATKIQVRFVVLDNPVEKANTLPTNIETPFGMKIKITPFNNTRPDLTRTLIFGSAALATDFTDSLFGEYPRTQELGYNRFAARIPFDARFFLDTSVFSPSEKPTTPEGIANWNALAQYGFGDYTHHDGVNNSTLFTDNKTARSHSRDIRSNIPKTHSNVHYVKFAYDGTDDFYPVVLEWDASQFVPEANTIHLKYVSNGNTYISDMRSEGTSIGNNRFTFSFHDKNVQEFWIEYTIGEDSREGLKDNFGDDIIVPYAWNFVSLPLNPVNKYHTFIYPNSLNIPYLFSQNQWQEPSNGLLQPGIGYFTKYNNIVDKKFNGAYFNLISRANFPVKLYSGTDGKGGWNAIGSLSRIVSTNLISFEQFDNGDIADVDYTLTNGIWAYRPNRGYEEVSALYPGKAYFIKVNRNSYLYIDGRTAKSSFELTNQLTSKVTGFDKISIADAGKNVANLYAANNVNIDNYELPPVPPTEMFDIRFSKNNYVTNYESSLVNMQGVTYPVYVNFTNPRANYSVIDPVSGKVYGKVKAGETNSIIIDDAKSNSFKLVAEASNETFFVTVNENPITTTNAEILFGIDNNANVSLSIFNAIGNEVANMNIGLLYKGIHNRTFDVSNLPSGSYTVRLLANGEQRIFMMIIK